MENNVAIYVRLSDEDRDKKGEVDSRSIQNQKSLLIDYAQKQGWNIYNIYSDDDYSGGDRNRPEWNKMLRDCKDGRIDIVLCKSQSRFSREIAVVEDYIHGYFEEWGVRFVSVVDNADTAIPSNRKSRQINGLINEWYLEDCSQNVKNVLRHKAQQGEYVGAFAPYGYKKDAEDKHRLVIDEEAAKIVRRIFEEYTTKSGVVKIAKRLNEEGVLPPSLYKAQQSDSKNYYSRMLDSPKQRQIWTASSITRMIVNEVYIGNMVQGKHHNISYKNHKKVNTPKEKWIKVQGTHEPIIDIKTWELAQAKRNSRRRESSKTGAPTPLSMKLFCRKCGAAMNREYSKRNYGKGEYRYIFCGTRRTSSACENSRYINFELIEHYIINEINKILKTYYDKSQIVIENYSDHTQQQIRSTKQSIDKAERELEQKRNIIYSVYQDKVNNVISEQQFFDIKSKAEKEIDECNKRLESLSRLLKTLSERHKDDKDIDFILSKYEQISELTPEITNEFIDKILLDTDKNGEINIEIYWKI